MMSGSAKRRVLGLAFLSAPLIWGAMSQASRGHLPAGKPVGWALLTMGIFMLSYTLAPRIGTIFLPFEDDGGIVAPKGRTDLRFYSALLITGLMVGIGAVVALWPLRGSDTAPVLWLVLLSAVLIVWPSIRFIVKGILERRREAQAHH